MSVSAVIVSYQTGPLLFRCLDSLRAQPEVTEMIVVDHGNPAEDMLRLHQLAGEDPRFQVLSGHGNIGFAAGCNLGAKAATGDHLLILNPDAELLPGGLATLLEETGPMTLIGGRLMGSNGAEQAGSRRGEVTPWTAMVELFRLDRFLPGRTSVRRINFHQTTLPDQTISVPTISGACMVLAREDYWVIGGMDEGYFLHVEDIDFCRRFGDAGGQVLFCPDVEVRHKQGSSNQSPIRVERWKAQSLTCYFRTHFRSKYPWGLVSAVCGLVWLGFGLRAMKHTVTAPFRR